MLRSFDGLAVRQLRTRPLRAVADRVRRRARRRDGLRRPAAGRHDPPHVRRPHRLRLGQDRPDRHGRAQRHDARRPTLDRVARRTRACATRPAWSAACSARLDARRQRRSRAPRARCWSPATTPSGYPPYDFRSSTGRRPRSGPRDRSSSATGRASAASASATRSASRRRPGRAELPRRRHLPLLERRSSFGGRGFAAMPLGGRAPADRAADGLACRSAIVADDRARRRRRSSGASQRALGPGAHVQTPSGFGDEISAAARRAQRRPLLLLGDRAVRRRLPDPQQLQHDRAPAHARARDAAHARRLAPAWSPAPC